MISLIKSMGQEVRTTYLPYCSKVLGK